MYSQFFTGTEIPEAMFFAAGRARFPAIIRLAGGMNNNADEIFPFFRTALQWFDGGVLMSGGTRCWTETKLIQPSVAEVVADIGSRQPHTITMGSFPQTAGTDEFGRGDHTAANPDTQFVAMIKDALGKPLNWDDDVDAYIAFMKKLRDLAGFKPALIAWNGGGVTVTETTKARDAGFDIFVISGSGREADGKLAKENFSGENVFHSPKTDPVQLQLLLQISGLSR